MKTLGRAGRAALIFLKLGLDVCFWLGVFWRSPIIARTIRRKQGPIWSQSIEIGTTDVALGFWLGAVWQ